MKPNPHIALIYHYDLARALAGEVVDWQAIPVNVDAGREGGDLCRAAADFGKRRDLFAMPAPTRPLPPVSVIEREAPALPLGQTREQQGPTLRPGEVGHLVDKVAAPVIPATVTQQVADPEPIGLVPVPGPAANPDNLRARIKGLVDGGQQIEQLLRRLWPEGVPTLKHDGHTDDQLAQILAAVRRVEAEVGAGWHPDDGPPRRVNTDHPTAEVAYPVPTIDEGGLIDNVTSLALEKSFMRLTDEGRELCAQIATEAHQAGRNISLSFGSTYRRWSIARAVIAWAATGRSVDELWMTAGLCATHAQCCDADATLGGLISQFTIEQADRLYQAAGQ